MVFQDALENVAFALVRTGSFMANAFLFGLPLLLLLVLRPGISGADVAAGRAQRRFAHRLEGLVQSALWASAVGATLIIVLQALREAGLGGGGFDTDSLTAALGSSYVRWHLVRLPLLAALAVMLSGKVRRSAFGGVGADDAGDAPKPLWWGIWIVIAVGLIATNSFSGHAAVSDPLVLAVLNDIVHLASGALWFSGIVILAGVLPDASRALVPEERLSFIAPIVVRFSWVALISISVVALTGTFNSLFNLETPGDLVDSGYGRVLVVKILAFLGVLAFGAINHFYVRRRLAKAAEVRGSTPAQKLFRRTIAIELALALLLMGLTGFLVGSARTRPSALGAREVISSR